MSAAAPTTSPRYNARPVAQYDDAGRKLAEFPTIIAAARAVGADPANINAAMWGRCRSAVGFIWRPLYGTAPDTIEVPRKHRKKNARAVVQYDSDGNKLAEHESSVQAAKAVKAHASSIVHAADGRQYTAGGFVWLWENDVRHLWREYARTRDVAIRNRLVERFYPLMERITAAVYARLPFCVPFDDVLSAAATGLMRAVEKFEPARGLKFSTYCQQRIKGAILDSLRDQDWVPRLARRRERLVTNASDELRTELGQEPTSEQLRQRLGLTRQKFALLAGDCVSREMGSLSARLYSEDNDRDARASDVISDHAATDPASDPSHTSLRDVLLRQFRLREALIVRLYYQDEMKMAEIGEALCLSESRVSQMHSHALAVLKSRYSFEQLRELIAEAA